MVIGPTLDMVIGQELHTATGPRLVMDIGQVQPMDIGRMLDMVIGQAQGTDIGPDMAMGIGRDCLLSQRTSGYPLQKVENPSHRAGSQCQSKKTVQHARSSKGADLGLNFI